MWQHLIKVFFYIGFVSVASVQAVCTDANPCGRYGYCRNLKDGNVTCECKFWWEGPHCDTQSKSGVQVIVLGCLLGLLIIIFYALQIIRCIRRKKKNPKTTDEKKEKFVHEHKILKAALKTAHQKARVNSCLAAVLTVIVAAGGLVGKWALIQPIHDEIVRKYLAEETIFYQPAEPCKVFQYGEGFNLVIVSFASFIILLLIVRSRRTACLKDKCKGHGAVPMPLDFLSHIDRKFAAFVFAIMADELIEIMLTALVGNSSSGEGVILSYLRRLLTVLIMGLRYFPMLACVYVNSIMSLCLGTVYTWLDYSLMVYDLGMCNPDFYPDYETNQDNSSSIGELLKYYGTGSSLIAIQLCTDIPRFVCLAYIVVKIPSKLVHKIYNRIRSDLSPETRMMMKLSREQRLLIRYSHEDSTEMLYVRNLFRGRDNRLPTKSVLGRIIPRFIYEWRDDYQFSSRVICVYASLLLLLYYVTIQACVQVVPVLSSLQELFQLLVDALSSVVFPLSAEDGTEPDPNLPATAQTRNFLIPPLVRPYVIAINVTSLLIGIQLLVLLANIRRNTFQAYRGDDSEIPRRQRSKYVSYSSGNVHFAGYFIGYLIWGYIIIGVFAVLICISIEALILYGSVRLLEKILKMIIPSILFVFFKQYLNKLLAQYVFLQHQGDVLALNNRRVLMVFIYFNFFLDAFLGFISSIMRLVKSLIGGILYMCRLDYSPLGRKLEGFDGGFSAYCGFIHTECTHRHPVMLVFASILYSQMRLNRVPIDELKEIELSVVAEKYRLRPKSSSRYRRKWRLAAFLVRNPSIVFFRKALLNQFHLDDVHPFSDFHDPNDMRKKMNDFTRRLSNFQIHMMKDNNEPLIISNKFQDMYFSSN